LIWNGAPLDEFAPVASQAARAVRDGLGIGASAPVVGAVARLSEQKGHRFLLDAGAHILRARPEVRFLLAGDGDQEPALRRQAAELGIAAAVVFAGHREDIPAVLGAIDVLCISSTYEGTPLSLFEAMASGKAIVSTAVDGCREVLVDGVSGLLVPPREPQALADALLRVLGDGNLRASLAASAREASRRYDVGACVRQMEALYDEVLAEVPACP
jgi:glycosyltransferase involved in cell wall biosynthesis